MNPLVEVTLWLIFIVSAGYSVLYFIRAIFLVNVVYLFVSIIFASSAYYIVKSSMRSVYYKTNKR